MNAYTTIEESKQLIEAGLDVNTADMFWQVSDDPSMWEYNDPHIFVGEKPKLMLKWLYAVPAWSLAALLNIIDNNNIVYDICNDKNRDFKILVYDAEYIKQTLKFYYTENNIVEEIIWLLKNNYIKSNKNE